MLIYDAVVASKQSPLSRQRHQGHSSPLLSRWETAPNSPWLLSSRTIYRIMRGILTSSRNITHITSFRICSNSLLLTNKGNCILANMDLFYFLLYSSSYFAVHIISQQFVLATFCAFDVIQVSYLMQFGSWILFVTMSALCFQCFKCCNLNVSFDCGSYLHFFVFIPHHLSFQAAKYLY